MNQKFFIFNLPRPLRPLREQSLPQSRIKNPESKITSPSNPLLLVLTLSLLSSFTASAWDDDTDSKPFSQSRIQNPRESVSRERGEESQITPVNDYGYKNPYQANSTHRSSAIDFGGPKRLAQADDDNDSKPFSQSTRERVPQLRGNIQNSADAYEVTRTRALHVDTVQESVALRDRESKEMMAESQRSFERQEAQQEKSRAQMAKQQEIYNKMDREEGEMAEFLGGVYKAKFGATTGHNSAITSDGYVFRSGNNFVTPKGIYTKTGNTYAGPSSFTTQTGTLFFGNESTTIQAGGAYFSEGKSGFIVSPNTSTWRTR
jgi:hypothetical protein